MWPQAAYYKLVSHMQSAGWIPVFYKKCVCLSDTPHRDDITQLDKSLNIPRSLLYKYHTHLNVLLNADK